MEAAVEHVTKGMDDENDDFMMMTSKCRQLKWVTKQGLKEREDNLDRVRKREKEKWQVN